MFAPSGSGAACEASLVRRDRPWQRAFYPFWFGTRAGVQLPTRPANVTISVGTTGAGTPGAAKVGVLGFGSQYPDVVPRSARATELFRAAGRLPAPRTSFVGRKGELDKVAGLLDRHRLVTVTGPGGSGRTRLALELGRRVIGRFADGVTWVDLSGVDQGALVPATIAAEVGVQERAGDSMLGSLVAGLSARQVLVVLGQLRAGRRRGRGDLRTPAHRL